MKNVVMERTQANIADEPDFRSRGAEKLRLARALTQTMDTAVNVPGTRFRFGLDAILGLIPGVGDFAGAGVSGYLVLLAARHRAPASVFARMLGNIGIDALIGSIPLLGDLFDVGWKANSRNLALLERHLDAPLKTRAASRGVVAATVAAMLGLTVAGLVLTFSLLEAFVRAVF